MANVNETAVASVTLDGAAAGEQIKELTKEAKNLRKALEEASKAGDSASHEKYKRALSENKKKQDELKRSTWDLEKVMKNLNGTSLKEMERAQRQLTNEIRNSNRATDEEKRALQAKTAQLKQVNKALVETKQEMGMVNKSQRTAGGLITKMQAGYFAAAAAIAVFTSGIKRAIDSYIEEEKALKKVEQAIKSTGGAAGLSLKQLKNEASDLQNKTIFGDETILNDVTAQLLTFTNITGNTFLRAQEAAMDLSTVLDGDLKSASIMLGKALNDPIQGLTAMRRVGIAFTDQQRAQIKELAESGRLMEAQGIILGELNRQYGGQAQAAAKGVGAIAQMNNKISDMGETIGKFLAYSILPAISAIGRFADRINNDLNSAMQSSTDKFNEQLDKVIDLTQNILPLADRYDELTSKSNRSTVEQNELNEIIKTISGTIPGAVTKFDEYGNAISISTSRVREFIQAEQDRLKVVNADAIKENQKKLKQVEKDVAESYKRIKQIEGSGTFEIVESTYTGSGVVTNIRKASDGEIANEQNKYKELLSMRNGYNAQIKVLNGAYIDEEIERRKQDAKNAEEIENKKQEYKKKSIKVLQKLSDEGDLLAEEEVQRRKYLDSGNKDTAKAATEYEKLGNKISEAKKQLMDFIAQNKTLEAQQAGVLLKSLEQQEFVIKKIAEFGGDVNKFLEELTDSTKALNDEMDEDLFKGLEKYAWYIQKGKEAKPGADKFSAQRDQVALADIDKADRQEKDLLGLSGEYNTDFYLSAIESTSSAAFDIWKAQTDARLEYELNALNIQMEKELSNKNLTEAQKDEIRDKYAKKERKLKQDAFKKQKTADIIQAVSNTALAVTKLLGTPPLAILAGIAGAAQIATIAAQPVPQFSGGGATGKGMGMRDQYGQVAGIVHADEYVIPEWMRSIPQVISFERVMEGIRTGRSYAAGGGTSAVNSTTIYNQHTVAPADQSLQSAIETLNAILARGVNTKLSLFDLEEYQQKKEDIESISAF